MKKLLSCFLVLALFLSLAGGWGGRALADTPADRVGTYEMTKVEIQGEDFSERMQNSGIVFTLVVREDGTATLIKGQTPFAFTWDEKNFTADDGALLPYTYEAGVLVMTEDAMVMTFEKVADAPQDLDPAAKPESIAGLWLGKADLQGVLANSSPNLVPYLETIPVNVVLEMREDSSYTLALDASPALPALKSVMLRYMVALCDAQGVTVEDLEASFGQTLEEIVEESLAQIDLDQINQNVEGVYEEANGSVIWDKGDNETVGLYTGDAVIFSLEDYGELVLTRASVVGLWIGKVDYASLAEGEEEEEEAYSQYFTDVTIDLILDLRSDGSFILTMDNESMLPALKKGMRAYMETLLEESGITEETLIQTNGTTMDELIEEALAGMMPELTAVSMEGTYTEKDGEITLLSQDSADTKGSWKYNTLTLQEAGQGDVIFVRESWEDILAKSEGVMSYTEYAAAETDSPVVIEAYVQDHQSWYKDAISVYAQDAEGGYFIYNMACSEEDAAKLIPGQKIRVRGYKAEWNGEVEIVDATFSFVRGSYLFRPTDVTALLGTEDLIQYQNQLVSFKGMTVEPYDDSGAAFAYKNPDEKTDDLYFKVSKDGKTYEFCVECDLRGEDTEVYKAVEALNVGDTVDMLAFLYWYTDVNPQVISLSVR